DARDGDQADTQRAIERALGFRVSATTSDIATDTQVTYLPVSRRIIVLGGGDPTLEQTDLVSQLTRALDDQRFALNRRYDSLNQAQVAASLASGSAHRVRDAYVAEVLGQQPSSLDQSAGSLLAMALLNRATGRDEERLLISPPKSTEALFDPTQLARYASPAPVVAPLIQPGDTTTGTGSVGPLTWLAVLSTEVDTATALKAVYGWGGDQAVALSQDGRSCVKVAVRGDTQQDTDELSHALGTWAAARSADRSVTMVGNQIELNACEPSEVSPIDSRPITDASLLITGLIDHLRSLGGSDEASRCMAINTVVGHASVASLDPLAQLGPAEAAAALHEPLVTWARNCGAVIDSITPTTPAPTTTPYTINEKSKIRMNPYYEPTTGTGADG
ncbi:MAG: hypothetical protein OEY23_08870, partial [Acidimicrobiia bacterium]|nr:hypothetical protein [Acidimicrobiia bacterium]